MRIRQSVLGVLAATAMLGLTACNRTADDWKTAQAADTSEAYQQFLKQHQDSEFAAKATERVKQLSDDREWQAASGTDTREAYEQFLAQHADSKWSAEAHTRIENFQQGGSGTATASMAAAAGNAAAVEPADAAPATAAAPVASGPVSAAAAKVTQATPIDRTEQVKPAPARTATVAKSAAPAKPLRVASITPLASGTHYAQLGAFSSRERAEQEWKTLHTQLGAELGSLQPHYTTGKSGSQLLYRLQVGLSSAEQAQDLCARLKKHSQACLPVRG